MSQLDLAFALVGGIVLLLALLSGRVRRIPIVSRPLVALAIGVLVGPFGVGVLDPADWYAPELIVEKAALVTIGIGLMGAALRLPAEYVSHHRRSLILILFVLMPLMTLASAALIWWMVALPFWVAALIAAVVTPTDPIVAGTIVAGEFAEEHLPGHLRHIVSAESGANDGLVYPLVLFPLLMVQGIEGVIATWATEALLRGVAGGMLLGWTLGRLTARWLIFAEERDLISKSAVLAHTLALTLLTLGIGELLSVSSILAVFVAGIAFDDTVRSQEREEEGDVQEAVNELFTMPIFTLIGIVLPWQGWFDLGWTGLGCVALILLLRRLPATLLVSSFVPELRARRDALFAGWFGSVGVAALYYALVARRATGLEEIWSITTLVIAAHVLAHGVTATPFTRGYARGT